MVRRRLRSYALLFVSLLGLMVALPVLVQAQTNPWATAVHNNTWFPNRDCAQPLRIKPLGDSITRGFGSDGPGSGNETNVLYNHGWRAYLDAALAAQGYQFDFTGQLVNGQSSGLVFDYDHDGFGGIRADQIRDGINNTFMFNGTKPPILPTTPADVVLLHIGTNDLAQGQSAASTVNDVAGILNEIDAYNTEVVVLVALIVDQKPGDPKYVPGIVSSYNNALTTMVNNRIAAGDKLILVNMFNALTYPADMFDWLHPLEDGYDKMDNVWLAQLLAIWPTCLSITSTPVTSAFAGQLYTYDVNAVSDPQPVTYVLVNAPAGMTINSGTGLISWTPAVAQAGKRNVTVRANNSAGSVTQTFSITVNAYFNYVPLIVK